jgi:LytS/YehU family sensor histidine kinase
MKRITCVVFLFFLITAVPAKATETDSLRQAIINLQAKHDTDIDQQTKKIIFISLVPTVVAFLFFFFILYRNQREALFRQKEAELNNQIAEVEMKALRAQINPHFIFNCLNSIHRFMYANKMNEAGEYLIKFSNLVRLVLENSTHREVPLNDDLLALQLYIEMEQLRMDHYFDYVLEVDPSINPHETLVPPLIIQPFVENSIWHGLNNKPQRGTITISISRENDHLKYSIVDNGVKTTLPDEQLAISIKKKSLGMSLTKERLDILNRVKGTNAGFTVSDILDENKKYAGKRVELVLPFMIDT